MIAKKDPPPDTVSALADRIAERDDLSVATKRSYKSVWSLLVRQVGARRPADKVYPSDVRRFLETREPETRDSYLRTLRAGFRRALKENWIGADPTEGMSFVATHVMGPWLPYSEWSAFLSACAEAHEIRAGFVLETGLRAGELAAARKSWLYGDIGRRVIKVVHDPVTAFVPKWGTERSIPLTDKAEHWLSRAAKKWGPDGFLFSRAGLSSLSNLARETRNACNDSRCTPTDFHGLRRSAGAHWLECGVTLFEVSRLLGHRDITTTQRWYAALADSALVSAIAHVEKARGPKPAKSETVSLGEVVSLGRSAKGSAKPVKRIERG